MKLDAILSIEDQIKMIKLFPQNILLLKDPCVEAQLEAIKKDWTCIQYIENPSMETQMCFIEHAGIEWF